MIPVHYYITALGVDLMLGSEKLEKDLVFTNLFMMILNKRYCTSYNHLILLQVTKHSKMLVQMKILFKCMSPTVSILNICVWQNSVLVHIIIEFKRVHFEN